MPPSRRFVYEYHLRDHQQNLRLAFRAETAQRVLRLTMEDDRDEDGSSYPAFRRVNATRDYSLAYQGRASAAVSASQPGPSTRLPVVGGDVVKVDFFYTTPAGPQHQRAAAPLPTASPAPRSLRLLPVLLPVLLPAPGSQGQPGGVDGHSGRAGGVGLQLQLGGLLSGRARPQTTAPVAPYENAEVTGGPAPQPTMTLPAYLRWELRDAAGRVVRTDVVEVPTTEAGRDRWQHLSTAIAVDKGPDGKLTGTLDVQLLNEGSQPVYFDSLTIRHPQPALLVSQENHYYPFGLNLSGVAVNTRPAEMMSKRLYNGGSELEDELLGAEGGNYSTFYRRYDATIGRFLGVDPLADVFGNETPFHYASNDPVNANDPSGALTVFQGRLQDDGTRGQSSLTGAGVIKTLFETDPTGFGLGALSHNNGGNLGASIGNFGNAIVAHGQALAAANVTRLLSKIGADYSYRNGAVYRTVKGLMGVGNSDLELKGSISIKLFSLGETNPTDMLPWGYGLQLQDNLQGYIDHGHEWLRNGWENGFIQENELVSQLLGSAGSINDIASVGAAQGLNEVVRRGVYSLAKQGVKTGRVLGHAGSALTIANSLYEFANGTHNTHTLTNVAFAGATITAGVLLGVSAAPAIAVVALGYGLWSATVGDEWIDRNWGYR